MSETKTYNGWTNYETWNVALWIDNEQGSYNQWRSRCQGLLDETDVNDPIEERRSDAAVPLSRELQSEIEDANPLASDSSMWSDLLSAAISEVNWYEIASNWLADTEPSETAKDEPEDDEE